METVAAVLLALMLVGLVIPAGVMIWITAIDELKERRK